MHEMIDAHMHTSACGHASGSVAQMVSAAVFRGLSGIVMTEHLPLPAELDPDGCLAPDAEGFARYAHEVLDIAGRVKGLDVVLGAEADWLPGREEDMEHQRAVARAAGAQVLLGSVHFMDGWAFDDPTDLSGWDSRDLDEVWRRYFELWCDAARSGWFRVMAHPDLVKKFGHWPGMELSGLYAQAAEAAAEGGVLVEFSTAGWRKPVGEPYPGPALLAAFHDAGVDVTVGSDAHSSDEVGYRIGDAYQTLKAAGYKRVVFPHNAIDRVFVTL